MDSKQLWASFNEQFDVEGLKKDMEKAGGDTRREVPHGTYVVKITKLELTASKTSNRPMVRCWMQILEGDYRGSYLFMNQTVTNDWQFRIMNEFLKSLDSGMEVMFDDYEQYGEMLMDILETIDGVHEYAVEYGERKGYSTFKVTEVFDLED